MKKVLLFSLLALALSVFSCGDDTGTNSSGGGDYSGGDNSPTNYTLTTNVYPSNGGYVSRSPNQTTYTPGTTVTVTATPYSGYSFTGWSGASTSTSSSVTITMSGNKTLTANFKAQVANAVIITLTYWATKATDLLDNNLDPTIYFNVTAYKSGSIVSSNSTGALLDRTDLGQSWSGAIKSSPVPFITSADELRITPIVKEKDPAFDDDISPGYYSSWKTIPSVGARGSITVGTASKTTSEVSYSYEFIWQ